MASAAVPILAGYLGSTLVSKIGASQGWDPRFTAIASILAGAGMGSVGAGVSAASGASSLAGSTATSVNPHAAFSVGKIAPTLSPFSVSANPHIGMGTKNIGNFSSALTGVPNNPHFNPLHTQGGTVPTVGGGPLYSGPLYDSMTAPRGSIGAKPNYFGSKSDAPTYIEGGLPSKQERFMAGMKGQFKDTVTGEKFLTALGTTFIDGMFAEPEKKQALSGGGGGGGGGSAPAYQGGQGGQYQLLVGFPQKATGPQWKEVA